MIPKPSSCIGCPLHTGLWGKPKGGFSRPDGTGKNGVLMVGEALGENEEQAGFAFVGKAGHFFFTQLKRVGIERDDFYIYNTVACRPPDNKLAGMPWEKACIEWCAPNLDKVIGEARSIAKENGRTFTILTVGKIAFKRVMGVTEKDPIMKVNYLNYPFWSDRYQAWIIAVEHPAYLIRGNNHLIPVLQFGVKRALEIAEHGMPLVQPSYLEDPAPHQFASWVNDFKKSYLDNPQETFLSYDIETPMKQGEDEEDVSKEEDNDYTILRCSFSYKPNTAVSVPWRSDYRPFLEELFAHPVAKVGWNNENYDYPRVSAQMPINGDQIDAMLAWHVLNTSLPKGLGYVTPFYVHDSLAWKHLSLAEPAFYNAKDADMALRCWLGIRSDLRENDLWKVFSRHVIEVNTVFNHMRTAGVLRDEDMRRDAEKRLSSILSDIRNGIEKVVPTGARNLKIYKKTPKSTEGMIATKGLRKAKKCKSCNALDVKATHFKSVGKKSLKAGNPENPCFGSTSSVEVVTSMLWAKPLEFKISNQSLQNYQKVVKHRPILDPKSKKITFDEKAIKRLLKFYPNDKLYPLILNFRESQGLLSKYIGVTQDDGQVKGGLTIGKDGLIHTTFTHNPSTLRSAAQNPPLQQLPRPKGPDDLSTIIRRLIVARPGMVFTARDYSGIEAVLVGYFAGLKDYIRLAKMDVHSFYTAYALNQLDGRVHSNDLPQLSWDDVRLAKRLGEIKKEFKDDRNSLYKHLIHGANFMQGARGAAEKILNETGIEYPVGKVQRVMDIYFELFPGIRTWHHTLMAQAEKDGYLRNPFGYVHRFSRVYEYERVGDGWKKEPGPEANKVIAFLPQSTAAGMIKEAMLRLYFQHYESAGQFLRLLVHDELFLECPIEIRENVDEIVRIEMERPVPELPLTTTENLVVLTEAKYGNRWGDMH